MGQRKETGSRNSILILLLILAIPLGVCYLFGWINFRTPAVFVEGESTSVISVDPEDGPYTLSGQWLRYEGDHLPRELAGLEGERVEDIRYIRKMSGYTYRFTLCLEDPFQWNFLMPRPHASRLWIDGIEVVGEEGGLSSAEIYDFASYATDQEMDIVLQVDASSPYDVYQGMMIGTRLGLRWIQTRWMILDLVAIGMSGMLILMCLGLFLPKRSETYLLLLAISAMAEVCQFLLMSRHPALDMAAVGNSVFYRQLGFINYVVCRQFVQEESDRKMDWAVVGVIAATLLANVVWPEHSADWLRSSYFFYMGVQAWILGKGVLRQIPQAKVIMAGCMLSLGNEIFYELLDTGLVPQGMVDIQIMPAQYMRFAYIVALTLATCMKYGSKFEEAEHLTEDLEKKVQEQTEELRRSNQQLVQTQENRQRFMMDLVHNLRSPLFAMGGYLDLLRDAIQQPTQEQEKYLDMLDHKTEHMGKMTDDMFLIYRLEDGQMQMDKGSFELDHLLEHVQMDAQAKGQEKEICVCLDMETKGGFLHGDRFRLKQAFDNILDNAIRYSPQGGQIHIRQELVEGKYYISIADEGPGISLEQQGRLFERYKSKGEGGKTGLGLSISHSIVQMHDGQIYVESKLGQGSTFTVVLKCENFNEISTESHQ